MNTITPAIEKNIISQFAHMYNVEIDALNTPLIPDEVIKELHEYVEREFNKLPCFVSFKNINVSCDFMREIFQKTGHLIISSLNNNSDLFPGNLNLKFRAIHDYIHIKKEYGCDFQGEYSTYLEQSKGLSFIASQVLFSEIVLQACFFIHHGYFPNKQKIVISTETPPK